MVLIPFGDVAKYSLLHLIVLDLAMQDDLCELNIIRMVAYQCVVLLGEYPFFPRFWHC